MCLLYGMRSNPQQTNRSWMPINHPSGYFTERAQDVELSRRSVQRASFKHSLNDIAVGTRVGQSAPGSTMSAMFTADPVHMCHVQVRRSDSLQWSG